MLGLILFLQTGAQRKSRRFGPACEAELLLPVASCYAESIFSIRVTGGTHKKLDHLKIHLFLLLAWLLRVGSSEVQKKSNLQARRQRLHSLIGGCSFLSLLRHTVASFGVSTWTDCAGVSGSQAIRYVGTRRAGDRSLLCAPWLACVP